MPIFSKELSRVKMVILTKHGHQNKVWYSILSKDKKNLVEICHKMMKRFTKSNNLIANANIIIFYDNQTKTELKRIKV